MNDDTPIDTPHPEAVRPQDETTVADRWLAAVLLGVGLLLRLLYIWHFRIDSDEPQHLHVVWGWTQGLLPYRDFFDNHTPVFQALYAPLFHLLGVRADIVLPMRASELPLYALTLFCVWKIARALYTPRIALWTAVLTALWPAFYLDSIEFRPDQLWTLVWMCILLVLSTGSITPRRMWVVGLLCGLSFSVSMKTTLFLVALLQALVGALLVRWWAGGLPLRWPHLGRCLGAWLAGIVIFPAVVVLYFYAHGAIKDMVYCVIQHNVLPGTSTRALGNATIKMWLLGAGGSVAGGWVIARLKMPLEKRARLAFLFLAPFLYVTTLVAAWPVLTAEDYLPFYPAMGLTVVPTLLWLAGRLVQNVRIPVAALIAAAEIARFLVSVSPFHNQTTDKIGMVADTLKLTEPGDYVMDSKGETIYRRRPFYYVFESMTFHRIQMGLIKDTIAEELIEKRVPLATTHRMPHVDRKSIRYDARNFIKSNYVQVAFRLWVLGQQIRDQDMPARHPTVFQVAVPQRYTLITPSGAPTGLLDGTPFDGPRELAAGEHTFTPDHEMKKIVLIWAPALERGYSPFVKIKADRKTDQD
ncbi:MAG: glycosyltransferase family 39 protein [Chthoniobacter sp.]|uniref:ArnT family glycosyltransferase n=1 Tax=Chthoniobacter sp. TaxID=2510640 RepID=UPI0032AA5123